MPDRHPDRYRSANCLGLKMKAPSINSPNPLAETSSCVASQLSCWRTKIENHDAGALWRSLHRLVSAHPLVRSGLGSQQFTFSPAHLFSLRDLTQDLYLLLLQKGRFDYYLSSQMTDTEIER